MNKHIFIISVLLNIKDTVFQTSFQLSASVLGAIWVTSRFSYAWGYYTGGKAERYRQSFYVKYTIKYDNFLCFTSI